MLSLAINTGSYSDIEQYYESFKTLETRNETLIRCVCASLVICGKYFFRQKQNDKALNLLRKARVSAASNPLILREIITVLVDNKMLAEAEDALKRFPDNHRSSQHFVVSSFLVNNLAEPEKIKLIPILRNLVRENIREPLIWYWLIFHLVDCDKIDEAETIFENACLVWPDRVPYFTEALKIQEEEVPD
jgi:predicted nucleic acid-binding protein